jgi:hypothetical protein
MVEGARAKGQEVSYPLVCRVHRHSGMARKRQTRNDRVIPTLLCGAISMLGLSQMGMESPDNRPAIVDCIGLMAPA